MLALIKFLLPFLLQNSDYQPHRDEFLYLAEGSHPAFGYMEVPPLISVFAWLTKRLGNQYNLPEAYSDNASFLYWLPDFLQYQLRFTF